MEGVIIATLNGEEWLSYKELRLDALKNEPYNFGSTYEESLLKEDKDWINLLKKASEEDGGILLFAKYEDKLLGMIWASWDNKEKTKHIANIYWVYVRNEYRGKWIGNMLIKNMLTYLNNNINIEKVKLSVVTSNKSAINLYKEYGFHIAWTLEKELKVANVYYDEYVMEMLK